MEGTVKFFNENRGFGFVETDDGLSFFVHHSGIISDDDYKTLMKDEKVSFDLKPDIKGEMAVNVTPIN